MKKWCRNNSRLGWILCLNERHIEEGLYHKKLRLTTVKYLSGYRKHRYELADEPKTTVQQNVYIQPLSTQSNNAL